MLITTEISTGQMINSSQLDSVASGVGPVGYIMSTLLILMGAFMLMGNTLTIVAIVTTAELHTQTNRYILHLAIADSIVGVTAMWWSFNYMDFSFPYFHRLKFLCLFGYVLFFVSVAQSLFTLTLLAIDRLLYVDRPYFYYRWITNRLIDGVIACTWVVSLLYGICITVFENVFNPAVGCLLFTVLNSITNKVATPVPFLMLVCITGFCYLRIACLVHRHRKRIMVEIHNLDQTRQEQPQDQNESSQQNSSSKRNHSHRFNSTGVFVIINCLFIICWTPIVVCSAVLNPEQAKNRAVGIVSFLAMSNSGMNFIVLATRNKQFARAYKRLFSCKQ